MDYWGWMGAREECMWLIECKCKFRVGKVRLPGEIFCLGLWERLCMHDLDARITVP